MAEVLFGWQGRRSTCPILEEASRGVEIRNDYLPKGWNPPDTRARAIPGHRFGLDLAAEDKRALIAFLKTL